MDDPLIVAIIHRYNPGWQPPADTGRDWIKTNCAFHPDENASAGVSFTRNAYRCQACPARGDCIALIMREEGKSYRAATRVIESLLTGGHRDVPPSPSRKPSRRVSWDSGVGVPVDNPGDRRTVPARVRRRTPDWA